MASNSPAPAVTSAAAAREYLLERVGEAAVVQVYADGFSALSLREKTLAWHLYRAALAGRDIFYDQRYAHNLEMRDTLEAIVTSDRDVAQAALKGCATGTSVTGGCSPAAAVQAAIEGRATETSVTGGGSPVAAAQAAIEGRATETSVAGGSPVAQAFRPALGDPRLSETLAEICRYTKLFWINTGPYNNLTARKFVLACTPEALAGAAHAAARAGARFPLRDGETLDDLLERLRPMFFDAEFEPTVTCKNPPGGQDILEASANNLYVGVTMQDLDGFVERYPLNSRLVKADGRLVEEVCRVGGRYGAAIAAIVEQLEAAIAYAAEPMAAALRALVAFYQSGEIADREAYDIAWVQDKDSAVDTINGFVEVYLDARSIKGAWEALVFYVNGEKTSQIRTIAANAQWFEDHMPWDPKYRKDGVRSVTANAIDVIVESGESGPITPVGINLPNDQGIREQYGSKSVSLSNVNEAFDKSTLPEFRSEFSWTPEEASRASKWNALAGELTTNMHEVIGHASGKINERLKGNPGAVLKEQYSASVANAADKDKDKLSRPSLEKSQSMLLEEVLGKEGLLAVSKKQIENVLAPDLKSQLTELRTELERQKKDAPPKYPFVHSLKEGSKIQDLTVLIRGNYETPGEEAPRRFLSILAGESTGGAGRAVAG
jgi:hypothetical protein